MHFLPLMHSSYAKAWSWSSDSQIVRRGIFQNTLSSNLLVSFFQTVTELLAQTPINLFGLNDLETGVLSI